MKKLYDELSYDISKRTTKKYSTSFSLGILALKPEIRNAVYAVYGYVRLADEIVDSFHEYDKAGLLEQFKAETHQAIKAGISINPILQAFQETANQYHIDTKLIDQFLDSMEMDLHPVEYDSDLYDQYIFGSAEVVGLMCLQVFVQGDKKRYSELKPYAQKLGSAFQKVNFLRDLKDDYQTLGRTYFPNVDMTNFDKVSKNEIEQEIVQEFKEALVGIQMLPECARFGVYLAYRYYLSLFHKIKSIPAKEILEKRVRIPNARKLIVTLNAYLHYKISHQ